MSVRWGTGMRRSLILLNQRDARQACGGATDIEAQAAKTFTAVEALLIEEPVIIGLGIGHREVAVVERDEHHRLAIEFLRVEFRGFA